MTERESPKESVPEAQLIDKRRFSAVWIIPIVAVLIGAWLTWKSVSGRGPEVTITFATAEGIEAGITKVRYRDLDVGEVESMELAGDLTHVVVRARLTPGMERYLTSSTRFWVVRARVSGGKISALATLLSGAYIGMDPVAEGGEKDHYEGLEVPPVVTSREEGTRFTLHASTQGSLDVGVPVHFHQVQVGEVVRVELDRDGKVVVDVFVRTPHDQRVKSTTRWWNASGFDATFNQEGLRIETQSILSLLIGGVAFETPPEPPGEPATAETPFVLAPNKAAAERPEYHIKQRYLLRFAGSAKGLSRGSPVEFLGNRIGSVVDVRLQYNVETNAFQTPVIIELEPERVDVVGGSPAQVIERIEALVPLGLRARLESGNLLTGNLVINLEQDATAPPAEIVRGGYLPELPTVPRRLDELADNVRRLVDKIDALPLAEIGTEFAAALTALRGTLEESRGAARQANDTLVPALNKTLLGVQQTLESTQKTVESARQFMAPASPSVVQTQRLISEMTEAVRSIRMLAEALDRNPESLLSGKDEP